jgi:DNA-binding transcriptional LysR family regulator
VAASLDDLVSMAVFARVVKAGSFTDAAAALGLSKSVVSARVSALEERLGVRLLHRTTRRVALTEDGARLYEKCTRLIAVADEAGAVLTRVASEPEGVVRVSVPVGAGLAQLPAVLRELSQRHPRLQVELSLTDRAVDVVADGFDVAIRAAEKLGDSTLVSRRLGTEQRVVCGAPAYFARRGTPVTPHDLTRHNCLLLAGRGHDWTVRAGKETVIVPVSGSLVADNIALLREAAIDGVGLARTPLSLVAADLEAGRLARALPDCSFGEVSLFLVHPYRRHLPTRVRAFVELLVAHFRAR